MRGVLSDAFVLVPGRDGRHGPHGVRCDGGSTRRSRCPRQVSLNPERRGIGLLSLGDTHSLAKPGLAIALDPRRSLAVTDAAILSRFSFEEVMNRLAEQSGVPGLTGLRLYQEWWDSQRKAPGLGLGGPHCNDQLLTDGTTAGFNGFGYACSRKEGDQAKENPFTSPDTNAAAYVPIGLFNRFDLAAQDGSDCGEYRIVFARRSGITNANIRNLLAFEGVLPNPASEEGHPGVPQGDALLGGALPGAGRGGARRGPPPLLLRGLGSSPPSSTSTTWATPRTAPPARCAPTSSWQPTLPGRCASSASASAAPATRAPCVRAGHGEDQPGRRALQPEAGHPLKEDFERRRLGQVATLAVNDVLRFTMTTEDRFNSGQSNSSGTENHYVHQFGNAPSPLRTKLQAELNRLGSKLTPNNIVARAQTLSCAGCHQLSTKENLGGGLMWPDKTKPYEFVHVTERTQDNGPDGPRFGISEALVEVFLPYRQRLMEGLPRAAPALREAPGPR